MTALSLVLAPASLPPERTPTLVYLASLAATGRRSQGSALATVAREFLRTASPHDVPWWMLRYEHMQGLRRWLVDRYAPATATRLLTAVRCVLRESMRLGLMSESDYRLATTLPAIKGSRVLAGRRLDGDELVKLFAACSPTPMGARNAAVLALLFGAGLRRDELVGIELADLDRAQGSLRVIGKGDKERVVPLPSGTRAAVDRWLTVRGDCPGPLVCPLAGDVPVLHRMSVENVTDLLHRLAHRAGVARFSPHDLRRSFITALLEAGVDLGTAQDLAGHASPTTTRRYDRRGEHERERAVAKLNVPFVDRSGVDRPAVDEPTVDA